MAGYVCTVAGGKGGVGKTTTTVNLAVALQQSGREVAVVDADLGMANVASAFGLAPETAVHDVLADEAALSEALTDGPAGVTVVAGEVSLEAFAEADPAGLGRVAATLRETFDVVLFDTGAGLSHDVAVPLGAADGVLLVSTDDDVAVDDADKTARLADRLGGNPLGLVVNRASRKTDVAGVVDGVGFDCLAVVPDDGTVGDERPVTLAAPETPAATAYRDLADLIDDFAFRGGSVADADPVVERSWFVDEEREAGDEPDDVEDGRGVFGLFG